VIAGAIGAAAINAAPDPHTLPKTKEFIMPQIATDVLAVLDAAIIEGSNVVLPAQLDRKLYVATDQVLQAAGGKWNRSAKAHVFDGNAADVLEPIILTGEYSRTRQDFGQFDTPVPLAGEIVDRAGIVPGMRVLEPSAGLGNLAAEAVAAGGHVHTVEIDPTRCAKLAMRIGKAARLYNGQVLHRPVRRLPDDRTGSFIRPGRHEPAIRCPGRYPTCHARFRLPETGRPPGFDHVHGRAVSH
jgi:hypothetical protein